MANSPRVVSFTVYDNTGAPLNGIVGSITFNSYEDSSGGSPSQPTFTARGGGQYSWTPVFADPLKSIFYTVDCGASASPRYFSGCVRPEDWIADDIKADTQRIKVVGGGEGKRTLITTPGATFGQEPVYDTDGTTVLQKYQILDNLGNPSTSQQFTREPLLTIP